MKIGIMGCAGRMGRQLLQEVLTTHGATLAGGMERSGSSFIGQDLGLLAQQENLLGVKVTDNIEQFVDDCDVVIDFTSPDATLECAEVCARRKKALVVGTTGLTAGQKKIILSYSHKIPVLVSANMSLGVTLLANLVKQAAHILGDEYDIEIVEMHHRHKVDAPSGTALLLGEAAAQGRNLDLAKVSTRVRDGVVGARKAGTIGFATLRGGDVVGDHTVMLAAEGERIELTHKASDRRIFSRGAVRAALWVPSQKPGMYSIADVLGLS